MFRTTFLNHWKRSMWSNARALTATNRVNAYRNNVDTIRTSALISVCQLPKNHFNIENVTYQWIRNTLIRFTCFFFSVDSWTRKFINNFNNVEWNGKKHIISSDTKMDWNCSLTIHRWILHNIDKFVS